MFCSDPTLPKPDYPAARRTADRLLESVEASEPNCAGTLAGFGRSCHALWTVLCHPAFGVLFGQGHGRAGRLHLWREFLANQMAQPTRWRLAALLRSAMVQQSLPISDPEGKADTIVAMLGAHAFWRHHPETFGLAEPEPAESVVPHVLKLVLGPEAAARIAAATDVGCP
jgi:hypothetical protein